MSGNRVVSALFVFPDFGENGAVRQTVAIAEGVAKTQSIESTIYVIDYPRGKVSPISIPVRGGGSNHDLLPFLRRLKIVSWINRRVRHFLGFVLLLVETRNHDVVLAAWEAGHGLTQPSWAARLLRKKFCIIIHNNIIKSIPDYHPYWSIKKTRGHFRSADHVVVVARGLEPVLRDFLAGGQIPPITVIQNGIDTMPQRMGDIPLPSCKVDTPIDELSRSFISIGRISNQKGFDLLIRSHAKARAAGYEHFILIAGDGNDSLKGELQALASSLGVLDSVRFLGFCKNARGLLRHAYGFCLTSRYEGFSLALAEAAVSGTPCIAMDCTAGPRDILEDGKYGDLVPAEDVEAMADAMITHLRDPAPLTIKAKNSQKDNMRLDKETMVTHYAQVIESLCR